MLVLVFLALLVLEPLDSVIRLAAEYSSSCASFLLISEMLEVLIV